MKTCVDCLQDKPHSEFRAITDYKDGFDIRCRSCRRIKSYVGTPDLLLSKIYKEQFKSSIKRGHTPPNYTLDELIIWANAQPTFPDLWDAFVASNYSVDLIPSLDRLDDALPYTLNNIQVITWRDNYLKSINSRRRAIAAYSADGTLHKTFTSPKEAALYVKGDSRNICKVAEGKPIKRADGKTQLKRTSKGFIWKWL